MTCSLVLASVVGISSALTSVWVAIEEISMTLSEWFVDTVKIFFGRDFNRQYHFSDILYRLA
jgi:hypothetical protein